MKKAILTLLLLIACGVTYADPIPLEPPDIGDVGMPCEHRTVPCSGDAKIRVCEGGTLIVDGGTINNAKIELIPGGHLIVRNNGTINMATGEDFAVPIGAIVDVEYGSINYAHKGSVPL